MVSQLCLKQQIKTSRLKIVLNIKKYEIQTDDTWGRGEHVDQSDVMANKRVATNVNTL